MVDYSYLINDLINYDELIKYGFKKEKDDYIFIKDLSNNNLYIKIIINDKVLVNVYDKEFDDEYLPFKNKMYGTYSSKVEDEVINIIKDIKLKCVIKNDLVDKIKEYAKNKECSSIAYPFPNDDISCTLKFNDKWYGLIMKVKLKVLGFVSEEYVDIINIKLDTDLINKLVDNKVFFKAYHMNKKYWITILLNNKLNEKYLFELIDKSYDLVSKKK